MPRKTSEDLEALERHEFGTDQFDAGKQLAEEWALPEVLQAAICQRRPDPGGKFGIPNLVSVACVIADQAGFSLTGQPGEWDSAVIGAILPDAAFERLVPRLASMKDEIPFKVRSFESEFLSK